MKTQNVYNSAQVQSIRFSARVQGINQPKIKEIVGDCFSLKAIVNDKSLPFLPNDNAEIRSLIKDKTSAEYGNPNADILLFPFEKELLDDELISIIDSKSKNDFGAYENSILVFKRIIKNAFVLPQDLYNIAIRKHASNITEC